MLWKKQYELDEKDIHNLSVHFAGVGVGPPNKTCGKMVADFTFSDLAMGFEPYITQEPDGGSACYEHCKAVQAHKLLLTLLLGYSVDTSACKVTALAPLLAHVIALAELYDFLPVVSAGISREFRQCADLWRDIATKPHFYLAISVKLKDQAIFLEALRHTVSTTPHDYYLPVFRSLSHSTGLEEEVIGLLVTKYRLRLDKTLAALDQIVIRHCQPETYAKKLGTAENMLLGKVRSNADYHKNLFRMFFKQWYDGQCTPLRKEHVYKRYRCGL